MPQLLINKAFKNNNFPIDLNAFIDYIIDNDLIDNFILVVPTGKLVKYIKNKIIRSYYLKHNKPVSNLNIFTFSNFVIHLFNKTFINHNYKIISDAYRLALFEEASEKADLKFFRYGEQKLIPTVLERLSNIVYGLKEDGIIPENIRKDLISDININNPEFNKNKLNDILSLYESYQKLLGNNYLDFPGLLDLTFKKLKESENIKEDLFNEQSLSIDNILPDTKILLLYGFSEFKLPEEQFLTLFINSTIRFAINIDYSVDRGPLFGNLEENIIRLTNSGFILTQSVEKNINPEQKEQITYDSMPRSEYLRKYLFKNDFFFRSNLFDNTIKIFEAENKLDEVRSISKLVKHLIINKNIKPSDICLITREPKKYSNLFRELFSSYKIPVNISDRYHLSVSPVIQSIFSVLDIVVKEFRQEDLHKVLQSPFLTFSTYDKNKNQTKIQGKDLYDISLKLRISGGYYRGGAFQWTTRIETKISFEKNKLLRYSKTNTFDTFELNQIKNEIIKLENALKEFKSITKLIPWKNIPYLPQEFNKIIKLGIINNLKLKENILEFYKFINDSANLLKENELINYYEDIEKNSRSLSTFLEILDEFTSILAERYPNKKFKLDELSKRLKTAVSAEKFQIKEKFNYGVTVTSIEQTRGIPYKVMILCGATDGEFPLLYHPESFLGKSLPETETRHYLAERIQFYQFLTNTPELLDSGDKQIYIFYPKYNNKEELARSTFIDELLKITTLNENNFFNLANIRKDYYLNQSFKDIQTNCHSEFISESIKDLHWLFSVSNETETLNYYANDISKAIKSGNKENNIKQNIIFNDTDEVINKGKISYLRYVLANTNVIDTGSIYSPLNKIKNRIPFSISELETYVKCPYQYFAKYALRLEEEEDYDFSLSSLEYGNILHIILYRFYKTIQAEQLKNNETNIISASTNKELPPLAFVFLNPEKEEYYKQKLIEIAQDELNNIRFEHVFFERDEEELLGTPTKKGMIEIWLKSEMNRIKNNWQFGPVLFEFAFGIQRKNSKDFNIDYVEIAQDMLLRGKIDKLELLQNDNEFQLLIADYKSSLTNVPSNKDIIQDGTSFQVPLYLISARILLNTYYHLDTIPAGGTYISLKPTKSKNQKLSEKFLLIPIYNHLSERSSKRNSIQTVEELEDILQESINKARNILTDVSNGNFPVNPMNDSICKYCSFISICRIKERHTLDFNSSDDSQSSDEY